MTFPLESLDPFSSVMPGLRGSDRQDEPDGPGARLMQVWAQTDTVAKLRADIAEGDLDVVIEALLEVPDIALLEMPQSEERAQSGPEKVLFELVDNICLAEHASRRLEVGSMLDLCGPQTCLMTDYYRAAVWKKAVWWLGRGQKLTAQRLCGFARDELFQAAALTLTSQLEQQALKRSGDIGQLLGGDLPSSWRRCRDRLGAWRYRRLARHYIKLSSARVRSADPRTAFAHAVSRCNHDQFAQVIADVLHLQGETRGIGEPLGRVRERRRELGRGLLYQALVADGTRAGMARNAAQRTQRRLKGSV